MDALRQKLNISKLQRELTGNIHKPKFFDNVKENTLLVKNYNFMADLLFLPTTKQGFKYCFVIVDLATDEFDIEPLKNKTPSDVMKAMNTINKRGIIKLQKEHGQSLRTDSGTEFQGVFHKYLYDNSILHRIGQPNRHIQMANVERLNGTLGWLFNDYMNSKELETGDIYREWTDIIKIVRTDVNNIRRKKLPADIYKYHYPEWNGELVKPKYKIGDLVYVVLETPQDTMGNKLSGGFRNGDYKWTREPHKITKVFYYHGRPYYRYAVNTFDGVSYQEAELKPATGHKNELFKVKQIIGRKVEKKIVYYLVWWKGYKKNESTWESEKNLIEDGLKTAIDLYNSS